jgi:hypothetical protein
MNGQPQRPRASRHFQKGETSQAVPGIPLRMICQRKKRSKSESPIGQPNGLGVMGSGCVCIVMEELHVSLIVSRLSH